MVELAARSAWEGLDLPLVLGGVTLSPLADAEMISVAPFAGRGEAVARAIRGEGGGGLPAAGGVVALTGGRLIWSGIGQWFLRGEEAGSADLRSRLAEVAAVTDQGDAWCGLALTGAGAAEVLARLIPIDLHPAALPPGRVARTALRHMICVLIAVEDGFEILAPRSFTRTAVHELTHAMRAVAARATLRRAVDSGAPGA